MTIQMVALSKVWKHAALSEGEIPEDQLDSAAYGRLLERKAEKQAAIAFFEDRDREVKAATDKHHREEMMAQEAVLATAEQWDKQMTGFGGRQITQAQAQDARQYMVDHRDETVAYGLQSGAFRTEAEGQRFVDN